MVDSVVDNWSMRTQRRGEIKLELAASTQAAVIQKVIAELKKLFSKNADKVISSTVHFTEIGKNNCTITAEYFTTVRSLEEFNEQKEMLFLSAKKILEDNNAEMSSPLFTEVKN